MGRLYIYLHIWLILMVKYGKCVGKYTSPMDASWDLNFTEDEYHEPLQEVILFDHTSDVIWIR